jgi:hypothetical protein
MLLEELLPKAVAWAEACSKDLLLGGLPLEIFQMKIACKVGVAHPELIRTLAIEHFPRPDEPYLATAFDEYQMLGDNCAGLTLGYGIYIREGCSDIRLLSHEFRHVYQYEKAGSIASFFAVYIQQILQVGYYSSQLEVDARSHEIVF